MQRTARSCQRTHDGTFQWPLSLCWLLALNALCCGPVGTSCRWSRHPDRGSLRPALCLFCHAALGFLLRCYTKLRPSSHGQKPSPHLVEIQGDPGKTRLEPGAREPLVRRNWSLDFGAARVHCNDGSVIILTPTAF